MQKTPESDQERLNKLHGLDEQIKHLLSCKPLPESQVKALCDKVSKSYQNISRVGPDREQRIVALPRL